MPRWCVSQKGMVFIMKQSMKRLVSLALVFILALGNLSSLGLSVLGIGDEEENANSIGTLVDNSHLPSYVTWAVDEDSLESAFLMNESTPSYAQAAVGKNGGPAITTFVLDSRSRTIVTGYSANLRVTLAGTNLEDTEIYVYLDEVMQLGRTAVDLGTSLIPISEVPTTPGIYQLIAEVDDQVLATADVEVVANNNNIWELCSRKGKTGFLEFIFFEDIALSNGNLTINGTSVGITLDADNHRIVTDVLYQNVMDGSELILAGLKYPRLFPSYTFTITRPFIQYQSDYAQYPEWATSVQVNVIGQTIIPGDLHALIDENWMQFTADEDFTSLISLECSNNAVIASLIGPDGSETEIGVGEDVFTFVEGENYTFHVYYNLFATFQENSYMLRIVPTSDDLPEYLDEMVDFCDNISEEDMRPQSVIDDVFDLIAGIVGNSPEEIEITGTARDAVIDNLYTQPEFPSSLASAPPDEMDISIMADLDSIVLSGNAGDLDFTITYYPNGSLKKTFSYVEEEVLYVVASRTYDMMTEPDTLSVSGISQTNAIDLFYFQFLHQDDVDYVCQLVHTPETLEDESVAWFYLASDDTAESIGECSDVFTLSAGVRYRYSLGYDTGENYRVYIGNMELVVLTGEEPYLYVESDGYHYTEYGIESESGGMQIMAATVNPPAQPYLVNVTTNSIQWKTATAAPTTPAPGWSTQYRIKAVSASTWGAWQSNSGNFTGLAAATGYHCQARFTANNATTHAHSAESPVSTTIWTAPNPPTQRVVNGTPTASSISVNTATAPSGWSTQYRIKTVSASTWGAWQSNGGTFTGLTAATGYQVQARFTASDASTHAHSAESPASATITTAAASVTLTVSPTSWNPNSAAQTSSNFSITSNTSWTISDDATWLSTSKTSGSGNSTFTITATANTSTSSRSATVTVAGGGITRTVSVTQAGQSGTLTVTLDRQGGTTGATSFTATLNSATLTGYTAPTRTNFAFDGYWTALTGGSRVINTSGAYVAGVSGYTNASGQWTRTTTSTTLYARWQSAPQIHNFVAKATTLSSGPILREGLIVEAEIKYVTEYRILLSGSYRVNQTIPYTVTKVVTYLSYETGPYNVALIVRNGNSAWVSESKSVNVLYDKFSAYLSAPTQPEEVTAALKTIEAEHNVWPAGAISHYYSFSTSLRIQLLTNTYVLAVATVTGGELLNQPEAASFLSNFLDNRGTEKYVNFKKMNNEAPGAIENRKLDINKAMEAAEHLAINDQSVTFCSIEEESHQAAASGNWLNAIGKYRTKIKCTVEKNGNQYSATIYYYLYDVYDWDRTIVDPGGKPVSQRDLWELQYGGLAKGYLAKGTNVLHITWTQGQRYGSGASVTDVS